MASEKEEECAHELVPCHDGEPPSGYPEASTSENRGQFQETWQERERKTFLQNLVPASVYPPDDILERGGGEDDMVEEQEPQAKPELQQPQPATTSCKAHEIFDFPFTIKLWMIVEDYSFRSIFWSEDGESFVIRANPFKSEVLDREEGHKLFEMKSLKAFVRHLNLHGFRKLIFKSACLSSVGNLVVAYRHHNFQRDQPHLLNNIQRKGKEKQLGIELSRKRRKILAPTRRSPRLNRIIVSEELKSANQQASMVAPDTMEQASMAAPDTMELDSTGAQETMELDSTGAQETMELGSTGAQDAMEESTGAHDVMEPRPSALAIENPRCGEEMCFDREGTPRSPGLPCTSEENCSIEERTSGDADTEMCSSSECSNLDGEGTSAMAYAKERACTSEDASPAREAAPGMFSSAAENLYSDAGDFNRENTSGAAVFPLVEICNPEGADLREGTSGNPYVAPVPAGAEESGECYTAPQGPPVGQTVKSLCSMCSAMILAAFSSMRPENSNQEEESEANPPS